MSEDVFLTIADMRPLYCVSGLRKGFVERGLDFQRFINEGMWSSELYGHGADAIVDRAIAFKRDRENG